MIETPLRDVSGIKALADETRDEPTGHLSLGTT
jgi:hypothetical protein